MKKYDELPQSMKVVIETYAWTAQFVFWFVILILLFSFAVRVADVEGHSMNNTLWDKDRTLILVGNIYKPTAGDIVVISHPEFNSPLVKRIIAVGGQTVSIDYKEQKVYIDDTVINEPYINNDEGRGIVPPNYAEVNYPLTVPDGFVFVMGDNRNYSLDSRSENVGIIDERYITGKLILRIFPLKSFGIID